MSAAPLFVTFVGGEAGLWRLERLELIRGDGVPEAARLDMLEGSGHAMPPGAAWALRGTTSNERYVTRAEHEALVARQAPLGRPRATRAALILIRKSTAWWQLPQNERRIIFEEHSRHVATGLEYLPAVARRLHHGRDLGESFDFLTWFEYAPGDAAAFETLLRRLRATEEWTYVDREVDIRLERT